MTGLDDFDVLENGGDQELIGKISDDIRFVIDRDSDIRSLMESDFRMAALKQWDELDLQNRNKSKKPSITKDICNKYIKRIVAPFRRNPVEPIATIDSGDRKERAIFSALSKYIWAKANKNGAPETALKNAATCGYGYMHVRSDYVDDDGNRQQPCVEEVINPFQVGLGNTNSQDGSGSDFGYIVGFLSERIAVQEHGESVLSGNGVDLSFLKIPKGSVPEILYYWKKKEKKLRVWYNDGTQEDFENKNDISEEMTPMIRNSRMIDSCSIYCVKIVGSKIVGDRVKIPIKDISIIPVYGNDYLDEDGIRRYMGMVRPISDTQREINFSSSVGVEVSQKGLQRQFQAYAESFSEEDRGSYENPDEYSLLVSNATTEGLPNTILPMPQILTFTADGQAAQSNKSAAMQDAKEILGIYDSSMGRTESEMSGVAVENLATASELISSEYTDNLVKSLCHALDLVLQMAESVMDYPVELLVGNETISVVPSEFLKGKKYTIDAEVGPVMASMRKENIEGLRKTASLMGDYGRLLVPAILKNMPDAGLDPIIKKLESELGIGEETENQDPKAIEALNIANQTIEEQKQTVQYQNEAIAAMRSQLISNKDELENKLQLKVMEIMGDLRKEAIKQEGEDNRLAVKMIDDAEKQYKEFIKSAIDDTIEFYHKNDNLMVPNDRSFGVGGTGVPVYSRENWFK